jgi:predicted homoserine dehydrogenase-like protein
MGLAHGVTLTRAISEGEVIRFSDVELGGDPIADTYRALINSAC